MCCVLGLCELKSKSFINPEAIHKQIHHLLLPPAPPTRFMCSGLWRQLEELNLLPFLHQRQQKAASAFFYVHLNATRLKEVEGFHVSAVLKSPKRTKKEDEDGGEEKRGGAPQRVHIHQFSRGFLPLRDWFPWQALLW